MHSGSPSQRLDTRPGCFPAFRLFQYFRGSTRLDVLHIRQSGMKPGAGVAEVPLFSLQTSEFWEKEIQQKAIVVVSLAG